MLKSDLLNRDGHYEDSYFPIVQIYVILQGSVGYLEKTNLDRFLPSLLL